MREQSRSLWLWPFYLYALVLVGVGAGLAYLGGRLILEGGSWYYLLMGLALISSGILLGLHRRSGILLFGVASLATFLWALWEVGLNGWALVPRLAWLAVLGLVLLAFWPVVTRHFADDDRPGYSRRVYLISTAVLPALMILAIVVPLLNPTNVELADKELVQQRPQQPFSQPDIDSPDGNVAASHDASNWTAHGGSNLSNKFSPADQITPENVHQLEEAWHFHTGDLRPEGANFKYSFQSTPLVIDETLYLCTPSQIVIALDAAEGTEKWRFDPQTDRLAMSKIGSSTCRGVAYFEAQEPVAECPTRLIWPMVDGRMGAVDAETGELCESFGNDGYVDLNTDMGNEFAGFIAPTSPPLVMRGVAIIGAQVRDGIERDAPSGVVRAFDAITGEQRWAWDLGRPGVTTPPPPGETYTRSTPNVWSMMSGDDELGLVYLPTGNPASDFYGADRTELENEYTSSLVAVDAETGLERWHFRTVNHDLWDFDLSPPPNLVEWPTEEGSRPAVIQASKNGQVYVLDRATGEPILPVVQMPVPQGTDTEDWTAETQPISPEMPNTVGVPGKEMEILEETDTWGITPFDHLLCRIEFKQLRYEGPYTPPTLQGSLAFAGNHGGVNWGGVSVDLERGILVMNSNRLPYTEQLFTREQIDELGIRSIFRGKSDVPGYMPQIGSAYGARKKSWMSVFDTPCIAPPWGYISGTDLRTREVIWRRPLGTGYDSGPLGIKSRLKLEMGTPNNSGSVTTAGGMTFIGAALDQFMRGFNTETGELAWEVRLPAGAQANPMSFEINGRQYVVASVGGHGVMKTQAGDSVIAWALPEK